MQIIKDTALDQKIQALLDRIPQEVDKMIGQLKSSLINPMTRPQARRGLWDRFKNTMSNLWWGRYNQDNPYFWNNKLGDDLGQVHPEHVMLRTIPIEEYRLFREHCRLLETQLDTLLEDTIPGTENLAIIRLINQWGEQLKTMLVKTVKDHIYGAGGSAPATPAATPPAPAPKPKRKPADEPVWDGKDPEGARKGAEEMAKQMKVSGIIDEEEYQQILGFAKTNPELALKRIKEIQKRKSTGDEVADSKQQLRDRLGALAPFIEDEEYNKIKELIDNDDLEQAETKIAKFESEKREPTEDGGIDAKRATAMEDLDKAKERGLPSDKYEAYKKYITSATDPDTLDRIVGDLNRTAVIDDESPPESGTVPPEEDGEAGPSYSSYWDKKPNTGDRAWDNLSPSEKAAWNNYGGGHERRIAKKGLKGLFLPWILRLGDPRTKLLYNRDRHHVWNELRREERIELDSDPIKDRQDFEQRIERAKKLRQEYVTKLSRSRKSRVEIERDKLADGAGETRTEPVADDAGETRTEPVTPSRTTEIPDDSMPPNTPKDQDGDKGSIGKRPGGPYRTSMLDDDKVSPHDANDVSPHDANDVSPHDANDVSPHDANDVSPHDANDVSPHDALEQIGKAREEGIIDDETMEKLTDMVMNDKIKDAITDLTRLRYRHGIEDDDEIETWAKMLDWVAPRNVLREKVEYYKKLLREGSKCVR